MKRLLAAALLIASVALIGAGCSKGEPVRTATMPRVQKKAPPTPPPNIPLPTPVQPK